MFYYKMTEIKTSNNGVDIYNYHPLQPEDLVQPSYNFKADTVVFMLENEIQAQSNTTILTELEYNEHIKLFESEKPIPPPPPLSNEELTEESSLTSEYMVDLDFRLSNIELGL